MYRKRRISTNTESKKRGQERAEVDNPDGLEKQTKSIKQTKEGKK
jgi:hypothetical protein